MTVPISTDDLVILATGHSYEAVVTDPTCTEDGYTTYTCSVCGDSYTADETESTGHTEAGAVTENKVDATCTDDGSYDSVVYCSICGEELSRDTITVSAPGHSYEAVVTDPTCTEDGYTTYTCSVCGDSYTADETESTGHTEAEAVTENEVAATCTEDGSYDTVVYCTVCDEELSRETVTVSATGHTYVAVVTDPTCTEGGYTTYTCSTCGDSYTGDETEATGHTEGEAVKENVVAAT
ncbi:MAG: hypothetical protein LUE22_09205, partial [Oscillospiraceae bacterium]|nr:hypothetical protein [Oscillospiraceae bacterium]